MREGSLFAGIMGFGEGFRRAGFHNLWAVEKEPFCQAIIRSHFKETELFSDVRDCGKHNLRAVDVVTAGFPCQDLSVAGKRAGLAGTRSGLFWEVVRILGELRPAWFVLENVPGLFSSNEGRDFGIVLQSLDELGYGLAWRVLNSQFFGVAQRRRRVFIVGRFGKPCPQAVLFESEGGEGDFAESGETWAGTTAETCDRIASSIRHNDGGWEGGGPRGGYGENLVAGTLQAETGGGARGSNQRVDAGHIVAASLSRSNGHHGHSSPRGDGSDNLVAAPITASYAKQLDSSDRNGGSPNIVQQAISSKRAKGSSGPAGDEHHNLTVVNCLAPVGGGADDNDAQAGHIVAFQQTAGTLGARNGGGCTTELDRQGAYVSSQIDSHRMRDFAGLPEGLDSARYRALGNAVTVSVATWIGRRIIEVSNQESAA